MMLVVLDERLEGDVCEFSAHIVNAHLVINDGWDS
jgi:hypothetical protein